MRLAIEAAGVALWSWNVDTDKLTMDERGYHLWAVDHSLATSRAAAYGRLQDPTALLRPLKDDALDSWPHVLASREAQPFA